jgi:hypothetical protein
MEIDPPKGSTTRVMECCGSPARVAPERRAHPVPPADLASIGTHVTREVTRVVQESRKRA